MKTTDEAIEIQSLEERCKELKNILDLCDNSFRFYTKTEEIARQKLAALRLQIYCLKHKKQHSQTIGQTMSSFTIKKLSDGRFRIRADRKVGGQTVRYFNPKTNNLERE